MRADVTEVARELMMAIDPEWPDARWIASAETEEDLDADCQRENTRTRSSWLERGAD